LALAGAAAGCLLAYAGLDTLVRLLPQGPLPGEVDITLDGPALGLSLGAAVLSAVLFGIAPALYSTRRDLVEGLKTAGKAVAGSRGRLRNALVTGEVALALVLLLGAGVLMRSFVSLVRVDLGFDTKNVLVVPVIFAPGEYKTAAEKHRFYDQALQRIASVPGVEAVAATLYGPMSELEILGKPRAGQRNTIVQLCTADYFRTMGIELVRGRGLPDARIDEVPKVAVVNRTLAANYFKGEDPLGRQIRLVSRARESHPAPEALFEIVGIVEDVKNRGIRETAAPHVYLPGTTGGAGTTAGGGNARILVRTSVNPLNSLNAIRAAIASVNRGVALVQPMTLEESLEMSVYAQPRFSLVVFAVFAVTGTLLVAIGVFSVMAYTVSRQAPEIAVRMALGASRRQVLTMVLGLATKLLAAGVGAGVLASFATNRLIVSQLWNTSPHDPLTVAAAVSLIVVVALAACCLPAVRAMRIEPVAALRQE